MSRSSILSLGPSKTRASVLRPAALALAGLAISALLCGCSTGAPKPISRQELAEAQTFPLFTVYWVGMHFRGHPLTAADGRMDYDPAIGDSVYYGNCTRSGAIFDAVSCVLPLQVTTLIYTRHKNTGLGEQRNVVLRGVPAAIYDKGDSIELYSGTLAIQIASDSPAHAIEAANLLRPLNGPGTAHGPLPAPVYCPELYGPIPAGEQRVLAALPRHICRETAQAIASQEQLKAEKSE